MPISTRGHYRLRLWRRAFLKFLRAAAFCRRVAIDTSCCWCSHSCCRLGMAKEMPLMILQGVIVIAEGMAAAINKPVAVGAAFELPLLANGA